MTKKSNTSWFILFAGLGIVAITTLVFFKVSTVPDVTWNRDYDISKEDAGGIWLFQEMLKVRYGDENVHAVKEDGFTYLDSVDNSILILFDNFVYLNDSINQEITTFLNNGNEVLLIGDYLENGELFEERNDFRISSFQDSMASVIWMDCLSYTHEYYWRQVDYPASNSYQYFDTPAYTNDDYEDLALVRDSLSFFRSYQVENGKLFFHSLPELFINISGLQSFYRNNFNRTFDHLEGKTVYLHKFKTKNSFAGNNADSPLQFILSQPPLKYAYYLMLLSCLLFVLFGSKRKQKMIPIVPENTNTSLDYVHTMSELFKAQNQNEKLVPHMEKIFYNRIKRKYFLDVSRDNYSTLLAQKSKVPQKQIDKILNKFSNAYSYDISDDQLISLYQDIESFYKNCK